MSKKSSGNLLGLLAFGAVIIAAAVGALTAINNIFALSIPTGTLSMISNLFLIIVVLWCGWTYAAKCSKFWKTLYIALVILVIIGFVFGLKLF